jgi:hypothetical protein
MSFFLEGVCLVLKRRSVYKGIENFMSSLQDEYDSIVVQLDEFLNSSDLPGAIKCI